MNINEADNNTLMEILANRGIDARPITAFSMTELNNEITRRRMEAERAKTAWEEEKVNRLYKGIK